jgi:hypothetical protein
MFQAINSKVNKEVDTGASNHAGCDKFPKCPGSSYNAFKGSCNAPN